MESFVEDAKMSESNSISLGNDDMNNYSGTLLIYLFIISFVITFLVLEREKQKDIILLESLFFCKICVLYKENR